MNAGLIKRDEWVLDKTAKYCHDCGKEFLPLIRRRHHCRNCGNVYCDKCSNFFLNGCYFQWERKMEKNVRFCEKCFLQILEVLQKNGIHVKVDKKVEKKKLKAKEEQADLGKQSVSSSVVKQARSKHEQRKQLSKSFTEDKLKKRQEVASNLVEVLGGHQRSKPNSKHSSFVSQVSKSASDSEVTPDMPVLVEYEDQDYIRETSNELFIEIEEIRQSLCQLKDHLFEKMDYFIECIARKEGLYDDWFKQMSFFTKQAIIDVSIDKVHLQDHMDIADYVQIKKIPFLNHKATEYLKGGIILRKNVSHKKMSTYLKRPRVMVVMGYLEMEDSKNFDEILKNDAKNLKKMLEKIRLIAPNIIFVEKYVNSALLSELQKVDITVVQSVKKHYLEKICRISNTKPIKRYTDILQMNSNYCGTCEKLIFRNFNPEIIVNNKDIYESLDESEKDHLQKLILKNQNKDPTIMFMQTQKARNSIAITISGPSVVQLDKVKEMLRRLIRIGYNLYLEKEQIAIDMRFHKKLKENYDEQVKLYTCGDISQFLFELQNLDELFTKESVEFSKAKYVKADLSDIHDIQETNTQLLEKYIKENYSHFNNQKIHQFCTNCEIVKQIKVAFYQKNDIPLAEYIHKKVMNQNNTCSKCKKAEKNHWTIFYGAQCYIRIHLAEPQSGKLQLRTSLFQQEDVVQFDMEELTIQQQNGPHSSIGGQDNTPTKKAKRYSIETFLECSDCNRKISESFKLKKIHLEYSFYRFLQRLFLTCYKHRDEEWLYNQVPSFDQCEHKTISRVFLYQDTKVHQIFIQCNLFKHYTVQVFRMNSMKIQQDIQKQEQDAIEQRRSATIAAIEVLSDGLKMIIKKSISSNKNLEKQKLEKTKPDSLKNQFYQKINDVTKEQLEYFQSTQFKDILVMEYDCMRCFLKFQEILYLIRMRQKQKDKDETFGHLAHLFKPSSVAKTSASEATTPEASQGKDRMISYLINTKNIEKEVRPKKKTQTQMFQSQRQLKEEKMQNVKSFMKSSGKGMENSQECKAPKQRGSLRVESVPQNKLLEAEKKGEQAMQESEESSGDEIKMVVEKKDRESLLVAEQLGESQAQMDVGSVQSQIQIQQNQSSKIEFGLKKNWEWYSLNYNEKQVGRGIFVRGSTTQTYTYNQPFIPIYSMDDVSIIGYALNSKVYYEQIYVKERFDEIVDKDLASKILLSAGNDDDKSVLSTKVVLEVFSANATVSKLSQAQSQTPSSSTLQSNQTDNFKLDSISEEQEFRNTQEQQENEQTVIGGQESHATKIKGQAEVIIYYPIEFECLRQLNSITLSTYIKSLASCRSWDSAGGKSGASFFKSKDDLFIFKMVSESEFFMFYTFAPQYFEHWFKISYEKQPSVLNKIYGMYEIKNKQGSLYYIAMENLFYGMTGELTVYDLKGSQSKRWNKKRGKTILDTNFIIEQNGEPLLVYKPHFNYISESFVQDSIFLEKCEVVDYSLLVVVDKARRVMKMGIIDYLQQYNLKKYLENRWKKVINLGFDPTILPPLKYKERFQEAMEKYFLGTRDAF